MSEELDRRTVTFEQAEGAEPLPVQLQLKEVSPELRARLWAVLHDQLRKATAGDHMGYAEPWIDGGWREILRGRHVFRLHRPVDEFDKRAATQIAEVKMILMRGDYVAIYGFLTWVIRHQECPSHVLPQLQSALSKSHAAWRITERTFVPVGSEEDAAVVARTFAVLRNSEFRGARTHLKQAAELVSSGDWGGSVKQSIDAIESVVRMIAGASTLGDAIKALERRGQLNSQLKEALSKLYGYTNSEHGVRHSLLEQPGVNVDEQDALFMFGACAAFITYMIGKGRAAGVIQS